MRVTDRTERDTSIAVFGNRASTWWDVSPDGEELVYIGSGGGADGDQPVEPTFVWILNWPEIVSGLSGGGR